MSRRLVIFQTTFGICHRTLTTSAQNVFGQGIPVCVTSQKQFGQHGSLSNFGEHNGNCFYVENTSRCEPPGNLKSKERHQWQNRLSIECKASSRSLSRYDSAFRLLVSFTAFNGSLYLSMTSKLIHSFVVIKLVRDLSNKRKMSKC